jgi:cell division protein FtsQ
VKPLWKYILIAVFTLLVLGYLGTSMWHFSGRNNEKVCGKLNIILDQIGEKQLITENEVAQILEDNGYNPIGKTIKHIQTEEIEKVLQKNPMIKSVECYKTPSGAVFITIKQRIPKFRVVGTGSYYIDNERKSMPVSPNFAAYVPVVSGRVTVSMAIGKMFDFVTYLEENPFWNAQIEQIFVRDDGKIELVPRVGESIIVLGTLDNYEKKLEKLHKLYAYGFKTIGWNKYKIIDLQYKDQVVCDKENLKTAPKIAVDLSKKDSIIAKKL